MYAYPERRDCLKWAALCYTLNRWEFERPVLTLRYCMEFKITKDKIANWNKIFLFLNKVKKIYSHLAWFLLSIWPIASFLGGFQVFVAAFYRRSQGWTLLFRKTSTARPFSRRNSNPLLDFFLQRKEGLVQSAFRPLVWKRYIDDILSLWTIKRVEIAQIIEQANSHHPTMKFTAEICETETTFLDTTISEG